MDCDMLLEAYYRRYTRAPIATLTSGDRPHYELRQCLPDNDMRRYVQNLERYGGSEPYMSERLARELRDKQLVILQRNAGWFARRRMDWEYAFRR